MPHRLLGAATTASHSTAAVARRLGVSIPTVQRWVDLGHLKAWKTVGGHRRIDAASVERLLLQRAPAAVPALPAGLSVLIVDDNPDDRDLLQAVVQTAVPGALVRQAGSGFEGLLCIGRQMPDVLITDIVMPHMDGLEMLRHVATRGESRPRLSFAVSARTLAQVAALGALPPGVRFVPKPLDAARMVDLLRQALPMPLAA
jgi:excisionase family DNA binding protein